MKRPFLTACSDWFHDHLCWPCRRRAAIGQRKLATWNAIRDEMARCDRETRR